MIFSVKQEIDGGAASERLGIVTICLAHLASSGSNTQRYLLEDAKSNSLLKITIQLKLIEGDVDFKVYLKVIRPGPSSKTHFQQEQTPTAVIKADQMVSPDNVINVNDRGIAWTNWTLWTLKIRNRIWWISSLHQRPLLLFLENK
jgi:hypothetical protein